MPAHDESVLQALRAINSNRGYGDIRAARFLDSGAIELTIARPYMLDTTRHARVESHPAGGYVVRYCGTSRRIPY